MNILRFVSFYLLMAASSMPGLYGKNIAIFPRTDDPVRSQQADWRDAYASVITNMGYQVIDISESALSTENVSMVILLGNSESDALTNAVLNFATNGGSVMYVGPESPFKYAGPPSSPAPRADFGEWNNLPSFKIFRGKILNYPQSSVDSATAPFRVGEGWSTYFGTASVPDLQVCSYFNQLWDRYNGAKRWQHTEFCSHYNLLYLPGEWIIPGTTRDGRRCTYYQSPLILVEHHCNEFGNSRMLFCGFYSYSPTNPFCPQSTRFSESISTAVSACLGTDQIRYALSTEQLVCTENDVIKLRLRAQNPMTSAISKSLSIKAVNDQDASIVFDAGKINISIGANSSGVFTQNISPGVLPKGVYYLILMDGNSETARYPIAVTSGSWNNQNVQPDLKRGQHVYSFVGDGKISMLETPDIYNETMINSGRQNLMLWSDPGNYKQSNGSYDQFGSNLVTSVDIANNFGQKVLVEYYNGNSLKYIYDPASLAYMQPGQQNATYASLAHDDCVNAALAYLRPALVSLKSKQNVFANNILPFTGFCDVIFDYHPLMYQKFRSFLASKYSIISNLNSKYGTMYSSFDQIGIPAATSSEFNFAPIYADYFQFYTQLIKQRLREYCQALRETDPECVLIFRSSSYHAYIIADALKDFGNIGCFCEGIEANTWTAPFYYGLRLQYPQLIVGSENCFWTARPQESKMAHALALMSGYVSHSNLVYGYTFTSYKSDTARFQFMSDLVKDSNLPATRLGILLPDETMYLRNNINPEWAVDNPPVRMFPRIMHQMGFPAKIVSSHFLGLAGLDILIDDGYCIGLSDESIASILQWVANGGKFVIFSTTGQFNLAGEKWKLAKSIDPNWQESRIASGRAAVKRNGESLVFNIENLGLSGSTGMISCGSTAIVSRTSCGKGEIVCLGYSPRYETCDPITADVLEILGAERMFEVDRPALQTVYMQGKNRLLLLLNPKMETRVVNIKTIGGCSKVTDLTTNIIVPFKDGKFQAKLESLKIRIFKVEP